MAPGLPGFGAACGRGGRMLTKEDDPTMLLILSPAHGVTIRVSTGLFACRCCASLNTRGNRYSS